MHYANAVHFPPSWQIYVHDKTLEGFPGVINVHAGLVTFRESFTIGTNNVLQGKIALSS